MFPFLINFLNTGGSSQGAGGFDFSGGLTDPLRIFGFKKYPPGGELYQMFLDVGYNVDLDKLGGTKAAYEIYKRLVNGDQDPLLMPFATGTATNSNMPVNPIVLGPIFWLVVSAVAAFMLKKK